jgi:hypothetical protein
VAKNRPFKKMYCDRPEVFLLPPSAFKVWMYHYIREGTTRESWPSLPTICEALDMNEETVKKARKYLKENGWLKQVGSKTSRDSGKFKVPVLQVTRGVIPPQVEKPPMVKPNHRGGKTTTVGVEKPPRSGAEKPPMDRGGKTATEVEPETQVDTYRSKSTEGDGFAKPEDTSLFDVNAPSLGDPQAGTLGKIQEPQAEKPPMVKVDWDEVARKVKQQELSEVQR